MVLFAKDNWKGGVICIFFMMIWEHNLRSKIYNFSTGRVVTLPWQSWKPENSEKSLPGIFWSSVCFSYLTTWYVATWNRSRMFTLDANEKRILLNMNNIAVIQILNIKSRSNGKIGRTYLHFSTSLILITHKTYQTALK